MQGSTKHVAGRVLLIVDPAVNEFESERAIRAVGGRVVEGDPRIGLRVVELAPGASEEAAVRSLRGQSGILAAELDELVPLSDITPNDPHYPKQTHLGAIKAPKAWVGTTGSPSVIVAVIDTGVNGDHPDLAGRLLPGWNTYDNNAIFADVYGHGTKVAGTMTAASNNGVGIASICWNCMILPIRASQPSGSASYSALAAGVMWAADHGARVANMSYQVSASSSVTYAAQYFMSKGGLVFASAGNYSTNDPAPDNPSIVTVSGVDPVSGNLYAWSNYGNNIDVTAPGCTGYTTLMNLGYGGGCGTSYSSPIAAAVAALIFSANPSLTPAQALGILKSSATDLGPAGWDIRFGAGMVDAEKAVAMANGQSTADTNGPAVSVVSPTSGTKLKGAFAASASVTDAAGSVESVTFKIGSTQVCHFVAAPYSCSIDSTAYPDGASQFIVVAVDDSGNTTTTPIAVIIENADITKPAVSITSPAAGSTVSGTISIAFAASDAVGVTGITVTAGSTAVCSVAGNATSCSWDTTKIANGLVPVTVTARDAAGNTQAATTSVTVANVDSIPPTVTILSPAGGASVSGSIAISFSAADDVGVVSTVVSAGATTLCSVAGPASSCSWNTLAVSNGPVTINVTARDAAGNSKSAATNVTVANADNVKPTVAITAPAAGATVSGTVGIAFSAADNVGVTAITVTAGSSTVCSLAGTATACSWNTTLVSNGAYAITVTARDNAGNVQSAIANVNVTNLDVQKPTVNILAPAAGATVTGTTVITFTTTDNVGVTGITVIAGSSTLCTLAGTATSCSWNTVQLANGAYTITVTARDAAGNSLAVARSVNVSNADKTAPAVTITAPAASASVTGTVPVTFSATDNVGVSSITVSAGGTTICTLPGNATSCAWDTTEGTEWCSDDLRAGEGRGWEQPIRRPGCDREQSDAGHRETHRGLYDAAARLNRQRHGHCRLDQQRQREGHKTRAHGERRRYLHADDAYRIVRLEHPAVPERWAYSHSHGLRCCWEHRRCPGCGHCRQRRCDSPGGRLRFADRDNSSGRRGYTGVGKRQPWCSERNGHAQREADLPPRWNGGFLFLEHGSVSEWNIYASGHGTRLGGQRRNCNEDRHQYPTWRLPARLTRSSQWVSSPALDSGPH